MKSSNSKIKLINYPFRPANQKGFTLLEVLVAILAVTLFIAFSLEGMVLASLAQIRAREKAEASLFIQRNLEEIKVKAAKYTPTTPEDLAARCTAADINAGLAAGLYAAISDDSDLDITDPVTLQASTRSYPFKRTIAPATNNILGISYKITDPKNTKIPPLAELYTEVIPDAVLQCKTPPKTLPKTPPG